MSGLINRQQGHLEAAEKNFRSVVEEHTAAMAERGFDFSKDYEVINELGSTLFERAKTEADETKRHESLAAARDEFEKTLAIDSENVTAHYSLFLIYQEMGEGPKSDEHRRMHERYREDNNARDRAIDIARRANPAADHAAQAVVIYDLQRPGATGLDNDRISHRWGTDAHR